MQTKYKVGDKVSVPLGDDKWHKGIIRTVFDLYGWSGETRYEVVNIGKPEFITVVSERCMRVEVHQSNEQEQRNG